MRGRPRNLWKDAARKDSQHLLEVRVWRRKAKDREGLGRRLKENRAQMKLWGLLLFVLSMCGLDIRSPSPCLILCCLYQRPLYTLLISGRGGPVIASLFLYVIQSIFLHYRTLVCKSLVTEKIKSKKKKANMLSVKLVWFEM